MSVFSPRPKGRHFTYQERIKIEAWYNAKEKQTVIAQRLHCSRSAICKEIQKGLYWHLNYDYTESRYYSADIAQDYAEHNRTAHGPQIKLGHDYAFAEFVRQHIDKYSVDAILTMAAKRHFDCDVSRTTLYRYIDSGFIVGVTNKQLVQGKRRKHAKHPRSASAAKHTSIECRHPDILRREDFGHWEMDSVLGKQAVTGESVIVLTERKYRLELLLKVDTKTAISTVQAMRKLKKALGKDFQRLVKSITVDNGGEFSDETGLCKVTGVPFFFCHPRYPGERGSNENANRLVRRYFPKGQSLKGKRQRHCDEVRHYINTYPRPMFGGESALERFAHELPALGFTNPEKVLALLA